MRPPPAKQSSSLISSFRNPSAAFRGKPFWSWNSHLDKAELRRQLSVLAEMGMGGFFIHARTGLSTEYLGTEWMDYVKTCSRAARRLGLESWLYDEDRWPSGAAGGLATKDIANRMRYLRCEILNGAEMRKRKAPSWLALFAAQVDGLNLSAYRHLDPNDRALRPGEQFVAFSIELVQPHSFFNGNTYLNTLDPAAVREFLRITHEQYRKSSGRMFGTTIPGIFTDEPHHGFVMCGTPKGWLYPPNSGWITPWTDGFDRRFEQAFGYDLVARLPELFLRRHGEHLSPVKWHYMELLHRLFLESFAQPIYQWCDRHHLQLTGHLLAEDLPGDQAITCGSVLRYYEHMHAPGMDQLLLQNHDFWMARQVASSVRQFGKKWALSELYGCTGWQLDFAGHKEIGDWQSFLGINLRCHHLSWYSMAGEAKRDFPASIFFQSAWYREYRVVEEYYSRIHVLLQRGQAVCDILVIHPVESVWAQVHADWAYFIKNRSPDIMPIDLTFSNVFRWLTADHLDFDYGDEEQLARLGHITRDATLRLGKMRYRAVVVAGLQTIRSSTVRLLDRFRQAGGAVIFAGPAPTHLEATPSLRPAQLRTRAIYTRLARKPLVSALRHAAPPPVTLAIPKAQSGTLPVILQTRREGDSWIIALCNTDASREFPAVTVAFRGPAQQVEEWDCRTGRRYSVRLTKSGTNTCWKSSLSFSGERIFRVTYHRDPSLKSRPSSRSIRLKPIPGPFRYDLDEPNILVLDRFAWRIGPSAWRPVDDILQIDTALRQRLHLSARGHGMMQPWARPPISEPASLPLSLRTHFTMRRLPSGHLHLVLEQPSRWTITLNGQPIDSVSGEGWFVDPCFRKIPLPPGVLFRGRNTLELQANFREGLDLEALYLAGSFGVYRIDTPHPVIDHLPAHLNLGDVCAQGLPHYSGRLRYHLDLPASKKRQRQFRLRDFAGAVATIGESGSATREILPFQPHVAALPGAARSALCEIILTRRNLFGPLHLIPRQHKAYTPASFRSAGPDYSPIPQLLPSGLLVSPLIEV
ncbi:glycosyl hydrolase [soil metagenome]